MRKAISMIELVIAIVVMGIVMATIPMFLLQGEQSDELAIQQEAILMAQSTLNLVLTNEWDHNTYNPTLFHSAVLDVANGDPELNRVGATTRRVGHVNQNRRRKFFPDSQLLPTRSATNIGKEGAETLFTANDIDDFHGETTTVQRALGTMQNRLLEFSIATNVLYVSDRATYLDSVLNDFDFNTVPANARTNIKMIQVNVQGLERLDTNITLRAYASNVGESQILWRDF